MDIKKWAQSKVGGGSGGASDAPPPGAPHPAAPEATAKPEPLFNPGIKAASLAPALSQWAQAGGSSPDHPLGPPPGADPAAFAHATEIVKKNWESYPEPWAVVAMAMEAMKPAGAAPAAPPPHPPAPGGPPGPPRPAGAPPRPVFGGG